MKAITTEKTEVKIVSSLKGMFLNSAIVTFFVMNFVLGIGGGSADAYLSVYLNDELNATYSLIGKAREQSPLF